MEVIKEHKVGYKKTKLGWIPDDWNILSIDKCLEIVNQNRTPISENERKKIQGDYPYYGSTKIQDYLNLYHYDGKYALIAEDGDHFLKYRDISMTQLALGKFNANNHVHVLKGTELCTADWFYWYFNRKSVYKYITRQGAGRYKLNKSALGEILIALPKLDEQKKIASILYDWDETIENVQKLIEKLQLRQQGLMQQLLTGKKRLSGFNEKWSHKKAKDFLITRKKYGINDGTYPLYSLTIENGVTPKTDRYIREFLVKDSNKKYKIVYPDDIVFNPSNLRWGAIATHRGNKKVILSPIYEVLLVKEGYDLNFISYLLTSPRQIAIFSTKVQGTLVERMAVKLDAFMMIDYVIPEIEEQRAIANILTETDQEIKLHLTYLEQLKAQKKGLMQQLLTGKIRVKV